MHKKISFNLFNLFNKEKKPLTYTCKRLEH